MWGLVLGPSISTRCWVYCAVLARKGWGSRWRGAQWHVLCHYEVIKSYLESSAPVPQVLLECLTELSGDVCQLTTVGAGVGLNFDEIMWWASSPTFWLNKHFNIILWSHYAPFFVEIIWSRAHLHNCAVIPLWQEQLGWKRESVGIQTTKKHKKSNNSLASQTLKPVSLGLFLQYHKRSWVISMYF